MYKWKCKQRMNKDFLSLMIIGKCVRRDHKETSGSQLFFPHMRRLNPSEPSVFSPKIRSHLMTELQLKTRMCNSVSTSKSVLSVAMAAIFLMRLSSCNRFFRNQAQNSSTSWLLSPSALREPWPSSSRLRKPWKVGRILSCRGNTSTGNWAETRRSQPRPFLGKCNQKEYSEVLFFFLSKWE